jgi:hypothetical protein
MIEALAAALLLGGINTIADYITLELRLQSSPIYMFARILLICYCVGGIVGARARQLIMGTVGGLMIGALVSAAYYLLAPGIGWWALAIAWVLFWLSFSLLDALLHGSASVAGGLLQGAAAAVLSAGFFYGITNIWTEPQARDPNLWRVLVSWSTAFFPGFIVLFWRKL